MRRIAAHAYKAGAGIVTPMLSDEEVTLVAVVLTGFRIADDHTELDVGDVLVVRRGLGGRGRRDRRAGSGLPGPAG